MLWLTLMLALSVIASTPRSLSTADHVLQLKRTSAKPMSSKLLMPERATVGTAPFVLAAEGLGYAVEITFGTEDFLVLFDTGSSDLWLPTTDFECVDYYGESVPTVECGFGPTFDGTFSDGAIADQNFNITYGDGEFLIGTLGYEDVTLADLTVEGQEVALVNYGYWFGDGEVSGLLGFAYPSLTSAYHGTDPTIDNINTTSATYNPFFFNAIQQGKVDPVFSIAIQRSATSDGPGGQLALGGLPTIEFNQTFTTAPLEIIQLNRNPASASTFSYYTICPEGFSYAPAANKSAAYAKSHKKFLGLQNFRGVGTRQADPYHAERVPVIVDSGTTLNYLPEDVAAAVNKAFTPPSYYSNLYGLWINDCTATPPDFSVRISGVDFVVNPVDLLVKPGGDASDTTDFCISGIQDSPRVFILGDVFLKNVVAVFDVGQGQIRFAPHVEY